MLREYYSASVSNWPAIRPGRDHEPLSVAGNFSQSAKSSPNSNSSDRDQELFEKFRRLGARATQSDAPMGPYLAKKNSVEPWFLFWNHHEGKGTAHLGEKKGTRLTWPDPLQPIPWHAERPPRQSLVAELHINIVGLVARLAEYPRFVSLERPGDHFPLEKF